MTETTLILALFALIALAVGVLLAAAGAAICANSLQTRHEVPALFAVWPLGLSIVTKAVSRVAWQSG